SATSRLLLRGSFADRLQDPSNDLVPWFDAHIPLPMYPHGNGAGVLLLLADDQHGVDAGFLGAQDAALELVVAEFELGADHRGPQLVDDASGVVELRLGDGEDAHLIGREPEREVAGVVLDEEAYKSLVGAQRRAMDAQRGL